MECITMFTTIYKTESIVRVHTSAPLLKERINFLLQKEKEGLGLRVIQLYANHLLFAVNHLKIKDESTSPVLFSEILKTGEKWFGEKSAKKRVPESNDLITKKRNFISFTVKWLASIGRVDPCYYDNQLIFNRFNKEPYFRIKYYSAPFFKERLDYLNYLELNGMCKSTLREYAEYQIIIINHLRLKYLAPTNKELICKSAKEWQSLQISNSSNECRKRYKLFHCVLTGWFRYMGLLHTERIISVDRPILDEFCSWMEKEKGLSKFTIESRERELQFFFSRMSESGIRCKELNADWIDWYIKTRYTDGCSRRSIGTISSTLRSFIRYLHQQEILKVELFKAIRSPKLYKFDALPISANWNEVQRLISCYDGCKQSDLRNRAILLLFVTYGIRCSELTNLKLKDIDWDNDRICIRRVKRGNQQFLPLTPIIGNAIIKYLKEGRNNDISRETLFITMIAPYKKLTNSAIYMIVSSAYRIVGIKLNHIGPHSLRHACATHLVNSGHSLKEISDLLGHRQLDTTKIYTKIDLKNLRQVSEMGWEVLL